MNKTITKIAAAVSTALLCALPMATSLSANAASFNSHIAADYLFGDVNHDGVVDARDASRVLNYLGSNTANTPCDTKLGDVNNNGILDDSDASIILSVYAKRGANKDLTGDANNNGVIDITDAVLIQQNIANPSKYKIKNMIYADVNRDNKITIADSNLIQRYLIHCFDNFNYNFGDVNNDGELVVNDAVLVTRYYGQEWNSRTISKDLFIRCDANGDGKINSKDQTAICNACIHNGYIF